MVNSGRDKNEVARRSSGGGRSAHYKRELLKGGRDLTSRAKTIDGTTKRKT